ncbi:serine/arginine repetitive matrix protein 2 isoform X2 [Hermetia illucens]|uniref:serine/arginine repetitive matrix protein 2 isoform X2 n=1 Tax=Hermetia illucens TaxID=343691 RepID=UPI0018CC6C0A|nr:serine/arginine repetitive matrix protein 2 isoform X2 [Hermetia illucens]
MIGSFWNLCRACPSMPVDKLHSEYRSTYRWHEYTGNSRPEVVRKPPVPNQFGPINEPPLPRRKKCPELAYRTHDFISGSGNAPSATNLRNDNESVTRARSEERGTPSRRSKSEGPPGVANGRAYPYENDVAARHNGTVPEKAGESSGLFKKTITKLSTEYRLQFVWPHVRKAIKGDSNNAQDTPRKSLSMGAIKSSQTNAMPTVHKKRTANEKEATAYELEPLVNDAEERKPIEKQANTEQKSNRPFTQMAEQERHHRSLTRKENFGFSEERAEQNADSKTLVNGTGPYGEEWYKDVIELRKKAGEYKCRGWGIEIDPELYKKQKELWDQVSRRSSLSALSLASSVHRPITKEEKEQENNKKSSPTKSTRGRVPGQAHSVDNKTIPDGPILPARVQTIRHHLERTTGPDVEEGALLPSPTREKLMPTIPKSKESEPYSSSQRGSPKKSATSRHGSPQKGSPQKGSPKKTMKGRSQSVGPSAIDASESPKRQIRSVSTAPSAAKANKKTPVATPTTGERRPRPSTLSTSTHSRSKSSSLPPSGRVHSTSGTHHIQSISQNDTNKTSTTTASAQGANQSHPIMRKTNKSSKQMRPKSAVVNGPANNAMTESTILSDVQTVPKNQDQKKLAENEEESHEKDGGVSIASHSPQPPQTEITEHIVKSPPEPTRVKSPEQIIMRSPDPVNWTVPLDTGKTFTVTQNVKDGENFSRPQSEVKASTPIERPPPAPQSAPPELAEQAKMEAWKNPGANSERKNSGGPSPTGLKKPPEIRYDKPVPGSSIRCLDDPSFESDPVTIRTTAADVLEKARDRFDRFWGASKEESV